MYSLDPNTAAVSYYDSDDNYCQAVKKAKIGHLGLLAQTCLKYSYEFNLIIASADSYTSVFCQKPDRKYGSTEKRSDRSSKLKELEDRETIRKKLKLARQKKRQDRRIELIQKQENESVPSKQPVFPTPLDNFYKEKTSTNGKIKASPSYKKAEYNPYEKSNPTRSNDHETFAQSKMLPLDTNLSNHQRQTSYKSLNFYENQNRSDYNPELFMNTTKDMLNEQQNLFSENTYLNGMNHNSLEANPFKDRFNNSPNGINLTNHLYYNSLLEKEIFIEAPIQNNSKKSSSKHHRYQPFERPPSVSYEKNTTCDQLSSSLIRVRNKSNSKTSSSFP